MSNKKLSEKLIELKTDSDDEFRERATSIISDHFKMTAKHAGDLLSDIRGGVLRANSWFAGEV